MIVSMSSMPAKEASEVTPIFVWSTRPITIRAMEHMALFCST